MSPSTSPRPWIIAHRGASADARGNSLEAFAKAIEVGADMIEFDVRRTRDGALVAYHDADVAGVPVGNLAREAIAERTGSAPALLDEILALARGRVRLDVELKEDGYVEAVVAAIRACFAPEQLVVTSFLDGVLSQVKALDPAIRTGLLLGRDRPRPYLRTRLRELFPIARARACGADFVAPHARLADLGVLRRADAAGLPCLVWTVNEDAQLRRYLADPRVAGVITDVPARALELRN